MEFMHLIAFGNKTVKYIFVVVEFSVTLVDILSF